MKYPPQFKLAVALVLAGCTHRAPARSPPVPASKEIRAEKWERTFAPGECGVIALDEFPIAPRWDGQACRATNHLHRPNDAADEWRITLDFVARIAERARRAGRRRSAMLRRRGSRCTR